MEGVGQHLAVVFLYFVRVRDQPLQKNLQGAPQHRNGGAQLMGDIGHEILLHFIQFFPFLFNIRQPGK